MPMKRTWGGLLMPPPVEAWQVTSDMKCKHSRCHFNFMHYEQLLDLVYKYVIADLTDDQEHRIQLSSLKNIGLRWRRTNTFLTTWKAPWYFDDDMLIIFSRGYANIIVFKNWASALSKITKSEDDDNISTNTQEVAKQAGTAVSLNKTKHRQDIDTKLISNWVSLWYNSDLICFGIRQTWEDTLMDSNWKCDYYVMLKN